MYYKQLQDCINRIDKHFVETLRGHESDFIKAYKCQMIKVRDELKFLKDKKEELQRKLMRDDRITNLQKEIKWFKSESVKLNQVLEL